jgi:serine/threonine protein kinase
VQYLGVTRDPESRLPVLLMELLDESLTKMLERSQQSLAYCVQVDICHDIALAVAYLHSNDIIHRDLSSNNVLMIAGRRAKVTDFGMSKLAGAAPSMTPLTMCPGTLAYMPPEALREPPRYTKKLDCFSEGVIMIQVCTRLWPEPGPRTQVVEDSRSPMGVIEMPVSETERRNNHIDMVDPNHALLLIAKDCIRFQEKDRPSSEELCQRLAGLNESREYRESTHQIQYEIQSNGDHVLLLTKQLQEQELLLQQKERQFQEELSSRERQLRQLNQQLEEQEQVTAEIQQTLQKQVEQLQQQLSQQSLKPSQPPPPSQAQVRGRQLQERDSRKQLPIQPSLQVDHKPHPHRVRKMTLNWRDDGKAPFEMSRGAAVVDGNVAYFMNRNGEVCSYTVSRRKWSKLPNYPYCDSSLAVINGQLTAIGGCKEVDNKDTYTNKLLSLPGYKEVFFAMPTKRRGTTAVTSKKHLIVASRSDGL